MYGSRNWNKDFKYISTINATEPDPILLTVRQNLIHLIQYNIRLITKLTCHNWQTVMGLNTAVVYSYLINILCPSQSTTTTSFLIIYSFFRFHNVVCLWFEYLHNRLNLNIKLFFVFLLFRFFIRILSTIETKQSKILCEMPLVECTYHQSC